MNVLARIADRVLGRPLLIHPAKAELIASVLGERIQVDYGRVQGIDDSGLHDQLSASLSQRPAANRLVGEPIMSGRQELYRRANGVGIIPVVGTLVNRGVAIGEDSSGFTSYESLGLQLRAALSDPQVAHILLDIDSGGGEATGMFNLTQLMRTARAQKPITAVVDDMAASAAYGIASSATEIAVSPTSIAGSIGVVLLHIDKSGEMQMKGRKPTMIYAGAHKVDGHPYGPLSPEVRSDLQREVDTFYDRFVEQVSAGRPKLTGDAIRATEARIFIGSEATDFGLADRVGTFEETLARLTSAIRATHKAGGVIMSNANPEMIARADHDAAIATARSEAAAQARSEGEAQGKSQAIDRIRAILTCEAAKGREPQALVFALDTDMAPDVAAKALAASPAGKAAAPPLESRGNAPLEGNLPRNQQEDARTSWDRSLKRMGAKLTAA
jgi:signal peptide peptidase SppA